MMPVIHAELHYPVAVLLAGLDIACTEFVADNDGSACTQCVAEAGNDILDDRYYSICATASWLQVSDDDGYHGKAGAPEDLVQDVGAEYLLNFSSEFRSALEVLRGLSSGS